MLLTCEGEVCEGTSDVRWIKGDEGELDALATYLEAVQVFPRLVCDRHTILLTQRANN